MYQTTRARWLFRLILWIMTRKDKDKTWFIFNPFKHEIQSLEPFNLLTKGRLYKHEMEHARQARELGTLRFIFAIIFNLLICGYYRSPLEQLARKAEDYV